LGAEQPHRDRLGTGRLQLAISLAAGRGGETDIQGMQLRRSALVISFGNSITVSASADYLGTLRSRVGVAYGRWLALATADLAYTTINHSGAGVTYSGSNGYRFFVP
jgi:hypothetical protein